MCLCYKEFEYVDRVHSECSNDGSQMGNARLLLADFINYDCYLSSVTRMTSLYSRIGFFKFTLMFLTDAFVDIACKV